MNSELDFEEFFSRGELLSDISELAAFGFLEEERGHRAEAAQLLGWANELIERSGHASEVILELQHDLRDALHRLRTPAPEAWVQSLGCAAAFALLVSFLPACTSVSADGTDDSTEQQLPATSVAKFCNDLSKGDQDVELTLEVGYPDGVSFEALSGTCSPVAPNPCKEIPVGDEIELTLRDGASVIAQATLSHLDANEEWIFVATIDDATGEPMIDGGPIKPEYRCSEIE